MSEQIPRAPPRRARGDVGREIGKWILSEITELLALAGIHGRTIDASHIVGVVPTAATKLAVYVADVLCGNYSSLNLTDNFECAPNDDPYFTGSAGDIDLSSTGVTPGTYGDSSYYPTLTIDEKGRVTYAAEIAAGGGPGAAALDDLTDVTLTSPTDAQVLTYDAYTNQWVNADPTGGGAESSALVAREEFAPASSATTVTLAYTPVVLLSVTRNGVAQSTTDGHFSVAAATLTFTTAFDGTDRVVVSYAYDTGLGISGITLAEADARYVPLVGGSVMAGTLSPVSGESHDLGDPGDNARWAWVFATTLDLDEKINIKTNSLTTQIIQAAYGSEAYYRFTMLNNGQMRWGPGNVERDVTLERTAASTLTLTGTLAATTFSGPLTGDVTGNVTGNVSGNAGTATALQTARNINGVAFDGTANITVTAAAGTLTGDTLASGVLHSSLTDVGTLTGLTIAGNLTFSGTTRRITGDFDNATHGNRVLFQTSTTNANTVVGALPNGTAVAAGFNGYGLSDPNNSPLGIFRGTSTAVTLDSNHTGSASTQPIEIRIDGSPRAKFHTSTGISFLDTTDPGSGKMRIAGDTTITGLTFVGTGSTGTSGNAGSIYNDSSAGMVLQAKTGSINDFAIYNPAGGSVALRVLTGTLHVNLGGNLTFDATGARITGDFTSTTHANRTLFQTSTANSGTSVGAIPSGSGTLAQWFLYNTSDANNAGYFRSLISGTAVTLQANASGTGTAPTSLTLSAFTSYVTDVSWTMPGGTAPLLRTNTAITSGAGANTGTLTNSPVAGNPTKWFPINDNGTTRYVPAW